MLAPLALLMLFIELALDCEALLRLCESLLLLLVRLGRPLNDEWC